MHLIGANPCPKEGTLDLCEVPCWTLGTKFTPYPTLRVPKTPLTQALCYYIGPYLRNRDSWSGRSFFSSWAGQQVRELLDSVSVRIRRLYIISAEFNLISRFDRKFWRNQTEIWKLFCEYFLGDDVQMHFLRFYRFVLCVSDAILLI